MTAQQQAISQPAPTAAALSAPPDTRRIAVMTLAHFINDSYGNYIAVLLPLLIVKLEFGLALAGLLGTCYQITSSIVQPALGYVADRLATRIISVLGTMAAATGAALMG